MRLLQRAVYAAKRLSHSAIGRIAIRAAKVAAGLYFDVFRRFYRTDGMIFYVPREQTTLSLRGKFVVDTYELPERTLVKRHLRRGATVLELGGGIGVLSCLINRRLDESTSHLVIEANPNLIPVLERNRHINHANFRIENWVISRGNVANIAISRVMDSSKLDQAGVSVRTMTLEDLEAKHRLTFDAIVMDIEGGEATFICRISRNFDRSNFLWRSFTPTLSATPWSIACEAFSDPPAWRRWTTS